MTALTSNKFTPMIKHIVSVNFLVISYTLSPSNYVETTSVLIPDDDFMNSSIFGKFKSTQKLLPRYIPPFVSFFIFMPRLVVGY